MRRHAHHLLMTLTALVLTGCAQAPQDVRLSATETLALQNRALNLLLTAAQRDFGVATSNAIEALVQVAPRDGRPAFRAALRSDVPIVRYAGLVALGEVNDCAKLADIKSYVRDPNPHVRLGAAFAAVRCGSDGYARLLTGTLMNSDDEGLRADAAGLLGRLQEPRARKWLRAALHNPTNEKSNRVSVQLYWALARLGDLDSVQSLIRFSQGDAATRTDALMLLADLAHPDARDALRYRLHGSEQIEEYLEMRLIAARGLGALGSREGYDFARAMLTYTPPAPKDKPPPEVNRVFPIRSLAVHALAHIGDPRALAPLRDIAESETDPRLQVAAAYAICEITMNQATGP